MMDAYGHDWRSITSAVPNVTTWQCIGCRRFLYAQAADGLGVDGKPIRSWCEAAPEPSVRQQLQRLRWARAGWFGAWCPSLAWACQHEPRLAFALFVLFVLTMHTWRRL